MLELHEKQGKALLSKNKITLCCSGIQGGKTTVGVLWFLKQIAEHGGPGNNFIIGAPSYKILNQSTLPAFFKYSAGAGTYHKVDQEWHAINGSKVFIRTSTDADSIEGITDVKAVWLDEAGKCKIQFWINAEGRAARTNAPIFCTTTPYGMNWPYKLLIKPSQKGERKDVSYFEWCSVDNPSFPESEYERQKQILDPKTFRRKYMGISERMEGLVYDLTSDNFCDAFALPKGTRYFAGVDFGFTEGHEFALIISAFTPDGGHYDIKEFKRSGLDPNDQVSLARSLRTIYPIEQFYCDPARPDMIAAFNSAGLTACGFQEGREGYKTIVAGVTKHNELIRSGKYKIFRNTCPQLEDEYETYHWSENEDGTIKDEVPVKLNDNLMDARRYLTIGMMFLKKAKDEPFQGSRVHGLIDTFNPTKKMNRNWESM